MSFSHSQGVQMHSSSLIDVQGDMHVYASQFEGDVFVNARYASPSNQPLILKPVLPPRPRLVIGRDREVNSLVDELLYTATPRLAILGTGGIGKTTLALAVLHDERISARWQSKIYFVNCEGVTSSELLVKELADVLRIPPDRRHFDIFDTVLEALAGDPVVLCLDNFETPWDDLALRPSIESALQRLDELQDLALLVTMRGTQRPAFSTINWSASLGPLKQLAVEDAELLFKGISSQMDEWSKMLVRAVDCVPLAVTLLAQLTCTSEGTETTKSLWNRWMTESTAVVENGGQDRLSKMDTSIQLSVSKVDEPACQILGMIALLPDGLNFSQEHIMSLQAWIPNNIRLKLALTTLARRALIYRRGDHYQMLTPIRHFTLQHITVSTAVRYGLIGTYLMEWLDNQGVETALYSPRYSLVPYAEFSEYENISLLAFSMENIPEHLSMAAIAFTEWLGWAAPRAGDAKKAFMQALQVDETARGARLQAYNHCWVGVLQLCRNELDNAETSFKQALELHSQANDVLGQANDHFKLGDIHMRRSELDDSLTSLKQALQLFEQAQSVVGQAHARRKLGELYMRRDDREDAVKSLKQALQLYEQLQYVRSQADACRKLGELHMRRGELDDAEMSLKQALQLHNQVDDVHGQADDHYALGELHMRRDDRDDAVISFRQALQLSEWSQYVQRQANARLKLGELLMHRHQLADAEQYLTLALLLHNQADDVHGQADDHFKLGELHMHRQDLDNAEMYFKQALQLYEQLQSVLSQAHTRCMLGVLHMLRDELDSDDAKMFFNGALPLYEQIGDSEGVNRVIGFLSRLSERTSTSHPSRLERSTTTLNRSPTPLEHSQSKATLEHPESTTPLERSITTLEHPESTTPLERSTTILESPEPSQRPNLFRKFKDYLQRFTCTS